jgi:hypothetical protein
MQVRIVPDSFVAVFEPTPGLLFVLRNWSGQLFALNDQEILTMEAMVPSGKRPVEVAVKACDSPVARAACTVAVRAAPSSHVNNNVSEAFLKNSVSIWVTSMETGGCPCN